MPELVFVVMFHKVLNMCVKRNPYEWTGFKLNCPKRYNREPNSCKEKKIIINVNVKDEQKGN